MEKGRYVIQEHHARKLHWDFRLEMDDVLKSWALPKTPIVRKGEKRLAIQTEDHDLSYIDFEGEIPEGLYGAGKVTIWDTGIYELESRKPEKLVFILKGDKMKGRYTLLKWKRRGEKNWLFFQATDKPKKKGTKKENKKEE